MVSGGGTGWTRPPTRSGPEPGFTRRLVAERRIRFTRVGRFVRIPESALREFIEAGTVEERGTEPTLALLRRLAAALGAGVRLTAGHDLGSVWFEPTQRER
jgi:excisionase family DNA binding protein